MPIKPPGGSGRGATRDMGDRSGRRITQYLQLVTGKHRGNAQQQMSYPFKARIRSKGKGDVNGVLISIRTKGSREEVILRKCRGKAAGLRRKHAHRFSRRSRRRAAIVSGGMSPRIFAQRAFFTSPSRKSIVWSSKSSAYCPSL